MGDFYRQIKQNLVGIYDEFLRVHCNYVVVEDFIPSALVASQDDFLSFMFSCL